MAKTHELWELLRDTLLACRENHVQRLAAALAYYAMFSLAPLLVLVIVVTGLAFGAELAEQEAAAQIRSLVGETVARSFLTLVRDIRAPSTDPATPIIGAVGLVLGAAALFQHLRESLNTIWGVVPHPSRGARNYLMAHLLSLAMVLGVALIALVGFALSLELTWLIRAPGARLLGLPPWLVIRGGQLLLSLAIVTLLVVLAYKLLPDTTVAWGDTWRGAIITGLLLVSGQALIGVYLSSARSSSAPSAIGAVVILLVWAYGAALIFFFGAEFTRIYADRYGSRIVPGPRAVALTTEGRAAQGMLRRSEIAVVATRHESDE